MYSEFSILHQKIQQDDKKAFSKLFDLLWKPLYAFAQSIVMDEDVAKDVVQEVWIDYWNRRKSIENVCIQSYLFKAVRYKVYNYLRDNKLNNTQIEVIQSIAIDADITLQHELDSTEQKINAVLKNLPNRCQEIFNLSRNEGMSNDAIASHYGISKRTVENQITLALKKIRETLLGVFCL